MNSYKTILVAKVTPFNGNAALNELKCPPRYTIPASTAPPSGFLTPLRPVVHDHIPEFWPVRG